MSVMNSYAKNNELPSTDAAKTETNYPALLIER